ncbi:MAG: hypothetical protein JW704_03080 [Anaerolineaceae bacterium]|nr:hypothetical protein [Anaerolineaceae bacterium]MBN2678434.1 hypothetical protein [Anaerolineaceae bacterium]
MNLLDKYIIVIGRKLPQKNRLDLQTEIRSTLEDMLEDRAQQTGRPIDNNMIEEVLKEYGSPAKVAAAYLPTRYLIGPQLYPFFMTVVKIVLGVLLAVSLASFLWQYYNHFADPAFLKSLGSFTMQFFGGATAALGSIVLIFAVLERVLPPSELNVTDEEWQPSDLNSVLEHLPPSSDFSEINGKFQPTSLNIVPDTEELKRGEMIFEIVFTLLGLALLNLYPFLIVNAMLNESSWIFIPALSDTFIGYLPWINLLGILSIVLDVFLLRQGFWQSITRIISLIIEVAGIVLSGIMLSGPSLVNFSLSDLTSTPAAESAKALVNMVHLAPKIILAILIIVQSVEVVIALSQLLRARLASKRFSNKRNS